MKNRTIKKICTGMLSAVLAAGLLSGCGSSASNAPAEKSESTATSEKTETQAGEKRLVIGTGQSCSTLDHLNSYDGWYAVRFGYGQTLTKMNTDMTISGWLVEDDYSANEDNTVWTFTVKDGVTFSNGKACDAAAVKASLELVYEYEGTRGKEYFTPAAIEADGQTLTITTSVPEPILPNKLADPYFVVVDATADMTNIVDEGPIGTGPFVVKSFDTSTKACTVVKNENYWGGEVKCDEIEFVYTEEQSTLTLGLITDDFDAVYNVSMTDIGQFEGNSDYVISRTASGRTAHGFMNQNGVLGDDVLRHAVMQLIDKETIVATQLNGQYVVGKTPVTSAAPYGYDELTDPYAYDPDAAAAALDAAGYADKDGDGFRETPSGDPIDIQFVYYTGRPEQQVMVEATQALLADAGLKVTPVVNDSATVMDRLASGDFDLLCMSINVLNCADPENHMKTYFRTGGSYQNYGWSNAKFDALIDELEVTADASKRISLVKEAEQILLDDAVCMYFCYPLMNFTMKNYVSGITSTPADYYWVSEETDINK